MSKLKESLDGRTILLDQIFGLVDGGATPVKPTDASSNTSACNP
jgi:hypothetical protein